MRNELNCQKLLNISVAHIRQQGKPAYQDGLCRYQTDDGLMCGAGIFLENPRDVPNAAWRLLLENFLYAKVIYSEAISEKNFVSQVLQYSHDNAAKKYALNSEFSFMEIYEKKLKFQLDIWNYEENMSLLIPE